MTKPGEKPAHSAGGRTADESSVKGDKGAAHREKASARESDEDLEKEHARFMKAHEKERKVLEDNIKEAKDRKEQKGNGSNKVMSDTAFDLGVDAAYASYFREQERRDERAKAASEKAFMTKELARFSDEKGRVSVPPRRSDGHRDDRRSDGHREDEYDLKFPRRKTDESRREGRAKGSR